MKKNASCCTLSLFSCFISSLSRSFSRFLHTFWFTFLLLVARAFSAFIFYFDCGVSVDTGNDIFAHTHTHTQTRSGGQRICCCCVWEDATTTMVTGRWQRGVRQTTTGALTTLAHTHTRTCSLAQQQNLHTHTLTRAETRCNERQQSDADAAAAAAAGTWHWTLLFALLLFSFFTLLFTRLQLQICCRLFLLGFLFFLAFYLIWVCIASLFYA